MLIHQTNFQLHGCIVWNANNIVFGSKHSSMCALALYFVHSTRPKIQGLVLRDTIVERSYGGLKSQDVVVLSKNDPLRANFLNFVQKGFIDTPVDVLCSNFVKFGRREIGKIVCCLYDKNISSGSLALATAQIAPKICQGQPPIMYSEHSRFNPNRFTFGGVIPNAWTPSNGP